MRLFRDIFTILKVLAENLHEISSCQTCPFACLVDPFAKLKGCMVLNKTFFEITGNVICTPNYFPDECPNKNSGIVYIWRSK